MTSSDDMLYCYLLDIVSHGLTYSHFPTDVSFPLSTFLLDLDLDLDWDLGRFVTKSTFNFHCAHLASCS